MHIYSLFLSIQIVFVLIDLRFAYRQRLKYFGVAIWLSLLLVFGTAVTEGYGTLFLVLMACNAALSLAMRRSVTLWCRRSKVD